MMYFKLLNIYIKNTFSKGTFGNTKTKKILFAVLMLYVVIVLGGSLGFMFYSLGEMLDAANQINAMIGFLGIYALIMPITMTLFRASGTLFYYKDFSIVGPLPIKSQTIFLAKLTVMMLWIFAGSLIFSLPIAGVYFYFSGFDIVRLLFMIVALIVIPLVPILLMSLISLVIGYISSKTRIGVMVQTILILVLLFFVMFFQFGFNSTDNPLTGQTGLITLVQEYYFPLEWFYNAITNNSALDLIYLVLFNVVLFIGGVYVFERLSLKINKTTVKRRLNTKKEVVIQTQPLLKTLIKKEFNKFFSLPIYIVNTGLGVIFILILGIASIFIRNVILDYLNNFQFFGSSSSMNVLIVLIGFFGFTVGLTYTPAVSLSLEGKNLWLLRSLPVEPKTIMFSKVLFNIVLVSPVALLTIIFLGFSLELTLIQVFLLALFAVSINVLSSHIFAIFNLFFPKFDFENEHTVIKQSMPVLLASFGGMGLIALHLVAFYFGAPRLGAEVTLLLLGLMNILLSAGFAAILYSSAEGQFKKY